MFLSSVIVPVLVIATNSDNKNIKKIYVSMTMNLTETGVEAITKI
jgi:hypothetical protein